MDTTRWSPPGDDFRQPGMDAVFFVGEGHALGLPSWYPAERMEEHLVQCLLRNPRDLTSHARRINLWLHQPGFEGLAAALIDLFLVLGPNGADLRHRLLLQAGARLPIHIREFLCANNNRAPADVPNSIFCRGPAYPGGPDVTREPTDFPASNRFMTALRGKAVPAEEGAESRISR